MLTIVKLIISEFFDLTTFPASLVGKAGNLLTAPLWPPEGIRGSGVRVSPCSAGRPIPGETDVTEKPGNPPSGPSPAGAHFSSR